MSRDNWPVLAMLKRDTVLAFRQTGDWALPTSFFALVLVVLPLGLGLEPTTLESMAPGLFWVTALLSAMMAVPQLFRADWDNGTLDQWVVAGIPLWLVASTRVLVHWVFSVLPLLALTPLLGLGYGLTTGATVWLVASLALGSPALVCLGGLGAALTLGVRNGGLLVVLLVMPLSTPVLVFGAGTVHAYTAGLSVESPLSLLAAISLASCAILPPAMGLALRIAVE
jgi:heme exporter protein B